MKLFAVLLVSAVAPFAKCTEEEVPRPMSVAVPAPVDLPMARALQSAQPTTAAPFSSAGPTTAAPFSSAGPTTAAPVSSSGPTTAAPVSSGGPTTFAPTTFAPVVGTGVGGGVGGGSKKGKKGSQQQQQSDSVGKKSTKGMGKRQL